MQILVEDVALDRVAYIYRPGYEPEQIVNPERLIGEGPVASFVLELADIWAGL
jgi:hypothetical protein